MIRILAVDDEPLNLIVITECLEEFGYELHTAADGETAWSMMQAQSYDLVILDRMMPGLDGLSLLKRIKTDARWRKLPVIMQTAAAAQHEVREGIAAGAYFYLTKPYEPESLQVMVSTLAQDLNEQAKLREAGAHFSLVIHQMTEGCFFFRTLEQAQGLATALANLCEDPASSCMGLSEILVNAVEHGNLGITYQEKSLLRQNTQWEAEIQRRLACAPWQTRRAQVTVSRTADEVIFTIADEGDGFNWMPFLEVDPARIFDMNGRGIAMARKLSFLSLDYQGKGNVVVARAKAAPLT